MEKRIGYKKRKKVGQKHERRRQRKMKVDARTEKSTRNGKKKGRVTKKSAFVMEKQL